MNKENLVILGSGPAGLTAAIYASRAGLNPLIIEGPVPGGQLVGTTHVENWPGDITVLGPELIMRMKEHAKHFGTRFLTELVTSVDFKNKPFKLQTDSKTIFTNCVIIATGAMPKKLGCPGEDIYWGKGVSTCAVCDGFFYKDKKVLIVGGGDTAMEEASFMSHITDKITVVHILPELTASKPMQDRVLKNPQIKIIYEHGVAEILGNGNNVTGVILKNQKDQSTLKIDIDGVFLGIGLKPSTDIFKGQLELAKNGYIKVYGHTNTSIEGVFVAGDVADYKYRQAITSAGSGCMAALDAEKFLKCL